MNDQKAYQAILQGFQENTPFLRDLFSKHTKDENECLWAMFVFIDKASRKGMTFETAHRKILSSEKKVSTFVELVRKLNENKQTLAAQKQPQINITIFEKLTKLEGDLAADRSKRDKDTAKQNKAMATLLDYADPWKGLKRDIALTTIAFGAGILANIGYDKLKGNPPTIDYDKVKNMLESAAREYCNPQKPAPFWYGQDGTSYFQIPYGVFAVKSQQTECPSPPPNPSQTPTPLEPTK